MNKETLNFIKGQDVCGFSNYRDDKPEDLTRLSYGDLKPLRQGKTRQEPTDADFLVPKLLSGSDYCSSGSVEVSNHRVFLERYGKLPNVYDVYGGYGTFAVAIRLDSITSEMIEDLNGLEDYCILDEQDHSEVEVQAEDDAWESCYSADFRKVLAKKFPAHDEAIYDWDDKVLDALFYDLMDRTNTCWEHETGNNAYVDLERVAKGATEQDITEAV
jgi:hypothetical protein